MQVGNAFAKQYYSTLQSSPEIAYRFYLNDSCLARPSGDSVDGDGANCVTTVQAIQDKITATCAGLASVEVLTVDSHHSYCGGVTVLVTGRFTFAGDGATASPRAFMQSFFLAPQGAKSYYVHNDTFRFIGGGGAATATASASTSPAMVAEPGKGEEKDGVHRGERRGDSEEGVEDAAGSSRLGRILGKLRGLLLSPGISVSGEQAEEPSAVPVKNEQPAVPVKTDDEPEENGFLVI
ncbi:unnamed protein product [Urochloa humidicola]